MRICLVDTLLETHLVESLGRALSEAGNDVRSTGRLWQGWRAPAEAEDVTRLAVAVDEMVAWRPDVVVAIRPSALSEASIDRLRAAGALLVAWFSDDPVLFKVQSRALAPLYDLTLHTADPATLELYEEQVGVRGWNFPFWSDEVATPPRYGSVERRTQLVFIGNTHTRVKRWRYDWIAALPISVEILGRVAHDDAGIHRGFVEDPAELAAAAAGSDWALNISQRFSDYRGTELDFPELAALGEFSLPSRVVQTAAAGIPTVSYVASPAAAAWSGEIFPPVRTVAGPADLVTLVESTSPGELESISVATLDWFRQHYHARRRAAFLLWLLSARAARRSWSSHARATAFLTFDEPRWKSISRVIRRPRSPAEVPPPDDRSRQRRGLPT